MNETGTTINNRKGYTASILHAILRALVCLMLLMACAPVAGETVHAATTYTAQGRLVLSASKKKGVEQEDSDMPAYVSIGSSDDEVPSNAYYFTTEVKGTLTMVYTAKNIPSDYCISFQVYNANTAESVLYRAEWPKKTGSTSASDSISTVLSPGTYIISSQLRKKVSGTLSVYFLPTVNSITLPESVTIQTGDSVSLKDVLTTDPEEYLAYCKSQAAWTSSNTSVATVSKKGKVTAKSTGTAQITMENPDGTTAMCTITVTDPVEGATEITPTTVQLSKETYTYSGKENKPKVTVLDQDGNEIPSNLVSVSYNNNINAGTANALVTVSSGTITQEDGSVASYHAATLTKTYTIKAATAKKVTVPKSSVAYKWKFAWVADKSYTGGGYYQTVGQKQKVTVYDSKGNKIDKSHYTVTYSDGAVHTGKVTVKVVMDKNYGSKTLKTTYTIKANSKTTKLFPKRTYLKEKDGTARPSFSYNKISAKNLKKLLPYGNKDVEKDIVYGGGSVADKTFYRDIEAYAGVTVTDSLKFTGTIGDLIQCCIQSKITSITYKSAYDFVKNYYITCEDGTEYEIEYNNGRFGLKSGYAEVTIHDEDRNYFVVAYIKP